MAWLAEAALNMPRLALPDHPPGFATVLPFNGEPSQLRLGMVSAGFSPPDAMPSGGEAVTGPRQRRVQPIVQVADPTQFTDEHWQRLIDGLPDLRALVEEVPADRSNRDARIIGALGRGHLFGTPGIGQERYAPLAFHILVTYVPGSRARVEGLGFVASILRKQEAFMLRRRRGGRAHTAEPSQLRPEGVSGDFSPAPGAEPHRPHVPGWDSLMLRAREHGLRVAVEWLCEVVAPAARVGLLGAVTVPKARAAMWLKGHVAPELEIQAAFVRAATGVADPQPRRVGRPPRMRDVVPARRGRGRPRNEAAIPASEVAAYVERHGLVAVARASGVDRRTMADYTKGKIATPKRVADRLRRAFGPAVDPLPVERQPVSEARRRRRRRQREAGAEG